MVLLVLVLVLVSKSDPAATLDPGALSSFEPCVRDADTDAEGVEVGVVLRAEPKVGRGRLAGGCWRCVSDTPSSFRNMSCQ